MKMSKLLAIISSLHPEGEDAIHPHGPVLRTRGELVALNPQPLPPREVRAAIDLAKHLSHAALEAELSGERSARAEAFLVEMIDDWCGVPWPRKWPWPWPGPRPDEGPHPDPWIPGQPDPWSVAQARVAAALVFASVGARLGEGSLRNVLLEGAERLAEAAVS